MDEQRERRTYAWQNQETAATFAGTGGTVTISGPAIAHSMTISSAGYVFTGGSLTVTTGGITAAQSVTINSPVYIGSAQSWNVAAGKTLTVNAALHTIISDLTFSGAGNTVVTGLDGGGVLNIYGGAKPGGLIQAGTGTVTLNNTLDFAGDITANAGAGPLNLLPTGGGSIAFSGVISGGGTINVGCSGTLTLSGASNFSGALNMLQPGTLRFIPAAGATSTFSGPVSGGGSLLQVGQGTTVLGATTYTGSTLVQAGQLVLNGSNCTAPSRFRPAPRSPWAMRRPSQREHRVRSPFRPASSLYLLCRRRRHPADRQRQRVVCRQFLFVDCRCRRQSEHAGNPDA